MTLSHRSDLWALVFAVSVTLTGCGSSHGLPDVADGGPERPRGDSGPISELPFGGHVDVSLSLYARERPYVSAIAAFYSSYEVETVGGRDLHPPWRPIVGDSCGQRILVDWSIETLDVGPSATLTLPGTSIEVAREASGGYSSPLEQIDHWSGGIVRFATPGTEGLAPRAIELDVAGIGAERVVVPSSIRRGDDFELEWSPWAGGSPSRHAAVRILTTAGATSPVFCECELVDDGQATIPWADCFSDIEPSPDADRVSIVLSWREGIDIELEGRRVQLSVSQHRGGADMPLVR